MSKKNRRKADTPPPPGGSGVYILVQTKEGPYWRRKRGTIKKAELNSVLKKNAEDMYRVSPAAKNIFNKLVPYFHGLDTGRFIANVSSRLKRALKETGEMNFTYMADYDFQPWFPMERIFKGSCLITEKNNEISIRISDHYHKVKRLSKLISDYYFEIVLLWGRVEKNNSLQIENEASPIFSFEQETKKDCRLKLSLPVLKVPWILILKLNSHEGKEMAHHPRHYGMKAIRVGGEKL